MVMWRHVAGKQAAFATNNRKVCMSEANETRGSKSTPIVTALLLALIAAALGTGSSNAQQITGVPGSPDATTTLDGKQLPPAPPKFGGVIKESAADSKPWWPPRVVPPKGAPNILLIM